MDNAGIIKMNAQNLKEKALELIRLAFQFLVSVKIDLVECFEKNKGVIQQQTGTKEKLSQVLNNISKLKNQTKIFIVSVLVLVPLMVWPSNNSEKVLLVNSQETFGECLREAGIGAFTVPSLGDTREKAEKQVEVLDFQGMAKAWIGMLDNGAKQEEVAMFVLAGLSKNKKLPTYKRKGLSAGFLLCAAAYSNHKEGKKSEIPLAILEGAGELTYKQLN